MRKILANGTKLQLQFIDSQKRNYTKEVVIQELLGEGSSCLVYGVEALEETEQTKVSHRMVLKEFYPQELQELTETYHILRDDQDQITLLIPDATKKKSSFQNYQRWFEESYQLLCKLASKEELVNRTVTPIALSDSYGTKYVLSDWSYAFSYAHRKSQDKSLAEILTVLYKTAKALKEYHKLGYLHLDVKPDNILYFAEDQYIRLFDCDTVVKMDDLKEKIVLIRCSSAYAAPELLKASKENKKIYQRNLDERTDIFALGAMLYKAIFQTDVQQNIINIMKKHIYADKLTNEIALLKDLPPRGLALLKEFLRNTIALQKEHRYSKDMEKLFNCLKELIELASSSKPFLENTSVWHKSANFLGREMELEKLGQKLRTNNLVFIQGMGGIGKSELARAYAEATKDYYHTQQFVTFKGNLLETILALKFHNLNEELFDKDRESLFKRKMELLAESDERTLIVIDNLELFNSKYLHDLSGMNLHLIFTTRKIREAEEKDRVLKLESLPEKEALRLFYQGYPSGLPIQEKEEAIIQELIQEIQANTLLIILSAKTIEKSRGQVSLASFLAKFQKTSLKSLRTKIKHDHAPNLVDKLSEESAEEIYSQKLSGHLTTIFEIAALGEKERELLRNLSLISYEGIIASDFMSWSNFEADEYLDSLNFLIESSWIETKDPDLILLHPLISALTYEELEPSEEKCFDLTQNLLAYIGENEQLYQNHQYKLSLSEFLLKRIETKDNWSFQIKNELYNISGIFYVEFQPNYPQALEYYSRALKISQETLPENHPYIAAFYDNIGMIYQKQGDYTTTLSYYLKTLKIRMKFLPTNHPDIGDSYNNLGITYYKLGDYSLSLDYHLKALRIRQEVLPTDQPNLADSYNNIGLIYQALGNYPQALEYYFKALKMKQKVLSVNHPAIADSYNNIGLIYQAQGNYPQALEYYFKALKIKQEVFPENHPKLAASYNNLGLAYQEQGDCDHASEQYLKTLRILQEVLPNNHPDIADAYNNIGIIYHKQGNYPLALKYYFKALKMKQEVLPKNHPNIADSYNNIGVIYLDQGEYYQALDYNFKALKVKQEVLPVDHPDIAASYNNIGLIYQAQGDYSQALEYYFKALKLKQEVLPTNHPDLATFYNNIGKIYQDQEDYSQALEYHFKALRIRQEVLPANHPDLATSYNNIGLIYQVQRDYPQALEYYFKALKIRQEIFPENHLELAASYNNLGLTYQEQRDYSRALEYHFKASRIWQEVLQENDPLLAASYDNFGKIYYIQENYLSALDYLLKTLKIRQKFLAANHLDLAVSYNNLGLTYQELGDYTQALDCHLKALKIRQEMLPDHHPAIADSYSNISFVYQEQKAHPQALDYHLKALKTRQIHYLKIPLLLLIPIIILILFIIIKKIIA